VPMKLSAQKTGSAVAVLLWLVACSSQRTELARVVSPDQSTVATLVREDAGGAAGSRMFYVYLENARDKNPKDNPSFSAAHCDGIRVAWEGNQKLRLEYQPSCDVRQFRNLWYARSSVSDEQMQEPAVEIVLVRSAETTPKTGGPASSVERSTVGTETLALPEILAPASSRQSPAVIVRRRFG
jgi:hypothetical protein